MSKSHLSFTFRPPVDVLEALEERAKTTGKGRSALVIEALRLFLDQPEPDGTITETDLKRLTDRLDVLEHEVRAHAAKLSEAEARCGSTHPTVVSRKRDAGSVSTRLGERKLPTPVQDSHPLPPEVNSMDKAIATLEHALGSVKPNNASTGLQAIKLVLPFARATEVLPQTIKDQLLRLLEPQQEFDRRKGGRVKAAIKEALTLLQGTEQGST